MPTVPLAEFVPLVKAEGDSSWRLAGRGFRRDPKAHLERYVTLVLGDKAVAEGVEGKRPGEILFVVGTDQMGDCALDVFNLLDKTLAAAPNGPYVIYAALLFHQYRLVLYKWERHPHGQVAKDIADIIPCFNNDREIRHLIGPAVRGMVEDVGIQGGGVKLLVQGVDFERTSLETMWQKPDDYPNIFP